jgi:hypothetical protein
MLLASSVVEGYGVRGWILPGVKWMHVDFEPQLQGFYEGCGFRSTAAGLIRLR